MGKFIYVFKRADRDILIQHDYKEMYANVEKGVFIFLNDGREDIDSLVNEYAYSDTLLF